MLKDFIVLYAEDEQSTRENTKELLELMFDKVYVAVDGKEGLELYEKYLPDIVILDIEMPHLNGLEVAETIRKTDKSVQIIVTTAYTDTKYFLKAIELNLVKYLIKPVILSELEDALKKAEQNLEPIIKNEIFITHNLFFDTRNRELNSIEGKIELTYQELLLLELLLKNANHSVSYETIESVVWDYGGQHYMTSTALRTLVRNLRKKLPEDIIENSAKLGYKINTMDD